MRRRRRKKRRRKRMRRRREGKEKEKRSRGRSIVAEGANEEKLTKKEGFDIRTQFIPVVFSIEIVCIGNT
jgi:hypothetical protein